MTYINKIKTFLKIDEALGDKRNHHIDALKGLVIVIVVWAHAIQFNDPNHDTNLLYRSLSAKAAVYALLFS